MSAIDNLETEVTEITDLSTSIITLLNGIAAELAASKNDPIKIQELANRLDSTGAALAAAIAANTPAAPPADPVDPVEPT